MIGAVATGVAVNWLTGVLARVSARLWRFLGRSPARAQRPSPWLSASTQRWHTNPVFAATGDRVDGHSCRVAILILQIMPAAPVELLRAAIVHDLGENSVGDIASPVKRKNPELYAAAEALELEALADMGFEYAPLPPFLAEVLHLCDGLDAYLWAVSHRPDYVRARTEWRAMFARLQLRADELGVRRKFDEIVDGVRYGKP